MESKVAAQEAGHRSKFEIGRKNLKNLFKKAIEENDLDKLDQILANECNARMLKKEKYLDPYIIAIKSNNLNIFGYLSRKGFTLEGSTLGSDCAIKANNKKCKYETANVSDSVEKSVVSLSSSSEGSDDDDENFSSKHSIVSNCKIDSISSTYSNALIEAIKCLNYEAIELLISLNVNTNSSNYKNVPLQIAYNLYSSEKDKLLFNNKHYNPNRLEVSIFYQK